MMRVRLFNGFDEATSNRPREARAQFALRMADDNLEPEIKAKAIAALQGGERDPIVDALFASCPICGERIEAPERTFTEPTGRPPRSFVWNEGTEHYVQAHSIVTPGLLHLIEAMNP